MACGKSEVQLSAAARGTARVEVVRRCAARLLRFAEPGAWHTTPPSVSALGER